MKSRERELTEDALKPSRNVFDRLGQNRNEDMCTHLETRHNSMTSRIRDNLPAFSLINDDINELRDRLEKHAARNIEAAPSTMISPFNMMIQQAPLPTGFRMPTMATYKGKTDP